MAVTTVESGTQSATGDHLLGSGTTTAGVYVCKWNLTDMVDGDVIRCYGGDPIVQSPPVVSMFSVRCGVEEVGANTVSVPWELISIT
jgi:hypothetical protein